MSLPFSRNTSSAESPILSSGLALPGSGSPDIAGARQLVARYKHAHMHADVVTSLSVLCDSNDSPCDGGPLGGI